MVQTEKVQERWEQTTWAKKLAAKAKRASLTDFDRFKLMVARKEKAAIVKKHLK